MRKSYIDPMPQFFDRYINLVEDDEIVVSLKKYLGELNTLDIKRLEALKDNVYAPGKWTIKDIFQHLIDNERIQSYRALRIARNDTTVLPGYDQNLLAQNTNSSQQSLQSLIDEYIHLRQSSIIMFKNFTDEMLMRKGICAEVEISVLALGFQLCGHQIHHFDVISKHYLPLL